MKKQNILLIFCILLAALLNSCIKKEHDTTPLLSKLLADFSIHFTSFLTDQEQRNTEITMPTPEPSLPASPKSVTTSAQYEKAWQASVKLSPDNFPDEIFRTLLSEIMDKNKDGILTLSERETLTELRDTFYQFYGDKDKEVCEPESEDQQLMAEFLSQIADFTGIEYFPCLKIIQIEQKKNTKDLPCSINLKDIPSLEKFILHTSEAKNNYSFHFENLPQLQCIEIQMKNPLPNTFCSITLKNVDALKTFQANGNIAVLEGLEETNVQKVILKLEKASKEISIFSNNKSEFTFDLSKYTNLNEFHIHIPEYADTYVFTGGTVLETLGVEIPGGTIILRDMPTLKDMRMLGGTAIQNENCNNLEILKLAKSGILKILDLSSFSSLKLLEILWKTMTVKSLILPNDMVELADQSGMAEMEISYQEQPFFHKLEENLNAAFEKSAAFIDTKNSEEEKIIYESVNAETLSAPGMIEFICTPGHGYRIDLNGDGVEEELYTDSHDFYINGTGLGILRNNYIGNAIPWETFWILVSDEDIPKRKLILNSAPQKRSYYSVENKEEYEPEYYWINHFAIEWGSGNLQQFMPDRYVGQFLLAYDGKLCLQAYAEGSFLPGSSKSQKTACYPFVQAKYGSESITFLRTAGKRIRVYSTENIPSLYLQK